MRTPGSQASIAREKLALQLEEESRLCGDGTDGAARSVSGVLKHAKPAAPSRKPDARRRRASVTKVGSMYEGIPSSAAPEGADERGAEGSAAADVASMLDALGDLDSPGTGGGDGEGSGSSSEDGE